MHWKQTLRLGAIAIIALLVLAACKPGDPGRSTGAYPIDIFQEMHYNQSQKAQEPPRFMPPEGSYPITGGYIPAPAARSDAARALENPLPADADTIERGALLYIQNCSMCHGDSAQGDGYVGTLFLVTPPNFDDTERIAGLTEGELFASISGGFGFMPAFQGLLTEDDRWALARLAILSPTERQTALAAANATADVPGIGGVARDGDNESERTLRLLKLRSLVD
jgi:mono/diheme cytochrome c family protein